MPKSPRSKRSDGGGRRAARTARPRHFRRRAGYDSRRAHLAQMAGQAGLPALLMAIYDLMRWGPTETNTHPGALIVVSAQAGRGWSRCWMRAIASRPWRRPPPPLSPMTWISWRRFLWRPARRRGCRKTPEGRSRKSEADGDAQRRPAGRLSDHRGACPGAGLRPHVRLRP